MAAKQVGYNVRNKHVEGLGGLRWGGEGRGGGHGRFRQPPSLLRHSEDMQICLSAVRLHSAFTDWTFKGTVASGSK